MILNALRYSLKIWLTSVLVSPVLFVVMLTFRGAADIIEILHQGRWAVKEYLLFVVAQLVFSFITWLVFWQFIMVIAPRSIPNHIKSWLIFFASIVLTLGTFTLVLSSSNLFNDPNGLINLMYANCFCIGWGVWYYDLSPINSITNHLLKT